MSSVNNDILSQALFQTGLSIPVKEEPEDTNFFFPISGENDFLSSQVQGGVGGLSSDSSLSSNSHPPGLFSPAISSVRTTGSVTSLNGGVMNQNNFISSNSGMFPSQDCYLNPSNGAGVVPISNNGVVSMNGGRTAPISSNGVIPPNTAGVVPANSIIPMSQQSNAGVSSNPGGNNGFLSSVKTEPFDDADIDLGDLLSIPTPDFEVGSNSMPSSSHSAPHSHYSMTPQVGSHAPFPGPRGPSLEFQSSSAVSESANSDLPILEDIFDILEDTEDRFLRGESPGNMSTAFTGGVKVTQQQSNGSFQGASSRSAFPPSSGLNQPYSKNNTGLVQGMQKRQPIFSRGGVFPPAAANKPPFTNRGFSRTGPIPSPGQSTGVKQVSGLRTCVVD